MNPNEIKVLIEAILLAAGRPVTTAQLLELFDERERPTEELLKESLALLTADYEARGIELQEVASGWRIQIRQKCVDIVSRLWQERPSRYSRALLETLALIAYRQPITRGEIEEIRGVAISSSIMRTLQERNWIRTVGHREVPGRPELIGTTKDFLDYFGLQSLDQLPTLAELRDVENIGVQLELPAGDAPNEAGVGDAAANSDGQQEEGGQLQISESDEESDSTVVVKSQNDTAENDQDGDDDTRHASEQSDSDEDGESDQAPTMVAESQNEYESSAKLYAPPAE
jgi:segregation and condensation protein B